MMRKSILLFAVFSLTAAGVFAQGVLQGYYSDGQGDQLMISVPNRDQQMHPAEPEMGVIAFRQHLEDRLEELQLASVLENQSHLFVWIKVSIDQSGNITSVQFDDLFKDTLQEHDRRLLDLIPLDLKWTPMIAEGKIANSDVIVSLSKTPRRGRYVMGIGPRYAQSHTWGGGHPAVYKEDKNVAVGTKLK